MEVAGLCLAIVPLCITALENRKEFAQGFADAFHYETKYARYLQRLGVCLVGFDQSIKRVFRAAGVSNDAHTDLMVRSLDSRLWKDSRQEKKLKAHFGESQYVLGFAVIMGEIREDVISIGKTLDVLPDWSFHSDEAIWDAIIPPAQTAQPTAFIPKVVEKVKAVKAGARLVRRGRSLSSAIKRLDANVEKLSAQAANTEVWNRQTQLASDSDLSVAPHLEQIRNSAQMLHKALKNVWACHLHDTHCVNLLLEPRLGTIDEQAQFAVTFAATSEARTWHSFGVSVSRLSNGGLTNIQTSSQLLPPSAIPNLCDLAERSYRRIGGTRVCLDCHSDQPHMFEQERVRDDFTLQAVAKRRESVKSLLRRASKAPLHDVFWSEDESISLGLTILSTFLQLSFTDWLKDSWSSTEIFHLLPERGPPNRAIDVDQMCVSTVFHSNQLAHVSRATNQITDDRPKLFRLGVLLLEICLRQTIESSRNPDVVISDELGSDLFTLTGHIRDTPCKIHECFRKAIKFCVDSWNSQPDEVDLRGVTRQKLVEEVLLPFQREHRRCRFAHMGTSASP